VRAERAEEHEIESARFAVSRDEHAGGAGACFVMESQAAGLWESDELGGRA